VANKKPVGEQISVIAPFIPYIQESFDLNRLDMFVQSLGTTFLHYVANISPIGLNEKGDYRRNNGDVDVITSNGYIYTLAGKFTAVLTSNQKDQLRPSEGGLHDSSTGNLVLPRFYDQAPSIPGGLSEQSGTSEEDCCEPAPIAANNRIYLAPGDRLYHGDPQADDLVVNKELLQFSFNSENVPMFPIKKMAAPLIDSRGVYYTQGIDYKISDHGNIAWIDGGNNPGIDPDTGEGRTYSVRYLYRAFYYITSILREVRITDVTQNGVRSSERMPEFVQVTREFLYHNINRGNELNKPPQPNMEIRQTAEPMDKVNINQPVIRVEMLDVENDT
jgi:hypothetical protein